MIKTLNKLVIEGNFLKLIKPIQEKCTANIPHTSERLNAFPLRSGTGQGCHHSYSTLYWMIYPGQLGKKKKSKASRLEKK